MNERIPDRVCAWIDLDAVRQNFDVMRRLIPPGTNMCAVIKTDAYGHGAVPIARMMEEEPYIWGFAVAAVEEAAALREAGIRKPILILGYVFPGDYETLARLSVRPAVFTEEMALALDQAAAKEQTVLPVHIALDTGMSRIGFLPGEEALEQVVRISSLPHLRLEGMFTHFARADEVDKTIAKEALEKYLDFEEGLERKGVTIPIRHCANSAAILELPEAHLNMVRAGITIYGIYPSEEMRRDKDLKPVMQLKSHVAHVKTVPAGTPVSYGGTFVTSRQTRIATIPVGYGDGYPRSLSNRGYVLIGGKKAPILGRVCMDQFMVDVTGMDVKTGDEVTLMGYDHGVLLSVEELGALSGRFPYEFVCDISPRVRRVYIGVEL
ncbi:MAG: alanine racemase [Lachnospiraceae bacterium]|nr:alanine racemase [Lachnospiraceae bacterium]